MSDFDDAINKILRDYRLLLKEEGRQWDFMGAQFKAHEEVKEAISKHIIKGDVKLDAENSYVNVGAVVNTLKGEFRSALFSKEGEE